MAESRSTHALCLTRGEVILAVVLLVGAVVLTFFAELVFGEGTERLFSITIDAIQGALFWSAVLIGIRRVFFFVVRRLRRRPAADAP
jgi:hypothetical protein